MSDRTICTTADVATADQARRGIPLWFAGTCLLGALCQPDVQATMRPEAPRIEAWSPVPFVSVTVPESVAGADDELRALGDAAAPSNSSGWTGSATVATAAPWFGWHPAIGARPAGDDRAVRPTADQAMAPPTLPADGRLLSALIPPAQDALSSHIAATWRIDDRQARRYVARVWDAAEDLDLDPFLMLAIMAVESSFDPKARSAQGAQGLMQVHARVHVDKFKPYGGLARAFDPEVSIRVGGRILKDYLDRYQTPRAALKAYVGAARLKSDGGYSAKVLKQHGRFRDVVATEFARSAGDRLASGTDRPIRDRIGGNRYVSVSAQP